MIHVLIDNEYGWRYSEGQGIRSWCIGSERAGRNFLSFLQRLASPNLKEIASFLGRLDGNFGFVVELQDRVIVASDKIRSHPVFYSCQGEEFWVSNSARALRDSCALFEFDPLSILEFQMAGYVTGSDTLLKELKQLQAGEVLLWKNKGTTLSRERYYLFYSTSKKETSIPRGIEHLDALTEMVFRKAVETLNGRMALVPLSGGLDSRLVVCMLKSLGYDNVLCYSYGLKGNWESRASQEIAERLGYTWTFVPYNGRSYRAMYQDKDTFAYFRFADGLSVLPFLQDRLCLLEMKGRGLVPPNAVFINGNSGDFITGGHIPELLMKGQGPQWERLFQGIVQKHYSLWEFLKTGENLCAIGKKIRSAIQEIGRKDVDSPGELCLPSLYEVWEWQERQCKFVVNGQRVYEYLGYSWLLPHWDSLILDFWSKVSPELKFRQGLYKAYLEKRDLFGLFRSYQPKQYVSPRIIRPIRTLTHLTVFPFGRRAWHRVDKNVFAYFTENLQAYSPFNYLKILRTRGGFRHDVSFRTEDYLQRILREVLVMKGVEFIPSQSSLGGSPGEGEERPEVGTYDEKELHQMKASLTSPGSTGNFF